MMYICVRGKAPRPVDVAKGEDAHVFVSYGNAWLAFEAEDDVKAAELATKAFALQDAALKKSMEKLG